ncbi:NirD/YgiW/YdeI family stress tolerance protein [Pleurocapsales cyanobacterium LEGE 06147]|nr:NirD/YgiW/YdeI family stress tolerance protein [Pleurocapsales cyanobacterium LEGE 06147]
MNQGRFWSLALTATISTLAVPVIARAQVSIEELQRSGAGVTISGEVVSVVGNDFVLDDGTGQIIVDAGPNWWHQIDVSQGEEVTVTGELGRGGELDAYSITRSDGSTIEIRSPGGPPPWVGGPHRNSRGPNP